MLTSLKIMDSKVWNQVSVKISLEVLRQCQDQGYRAVQFKVRDQVEVQVEDQVDDQIRWHLWSTITVREAEIFLRDK